MAHQTRCLFLDQFLSLAALLCVLLLAVVSINSSNREFQVSSTRSLHKEHWSVWNETDLQSISHNQVRSVQNGLSIGGGIDLSLCYSNLQQSDVNNDTFLSQSEYLTFVNLTSQGEALTINQWGVTITSFSMLPQKLIGLYNLYACGGANYGCPSITGINIAGVGTGTDATSNTTEQQTTILYNFCKDIDDTVEDLITPPAPSTASPSSGGAVSTSIPTSSPTLSVPIVTCPPAYVPNNSYDSGDVVINANENNGNNTNNTSNNQAEKYYYYYQCKEYPYTPWCSQEAYEPGVGQAWQEAWDLLGQCSPKEDGTTTSTSTITATITVEDTTTNSTEYASTTSATSVGFVTPSPSATVSSKQPTVMDPENPPYSGILSVEFQYEIGNNQELSANAIWTGKNPINELMDVILVSTTNLVKGVIRDTFGEGDRSLGRGDSGAVRKLGERITSYTDSTTNHLDSHFFIELEYDLRVSSLGEKNRRMKVNYSPSSLNILSLDDIQCPSAQSANVLCQKVFCTVGLVLLEENKTSTEVTFRQNLYDAIDNGEMSFPADSGVVYTSSPRSPSDDDKLPEIINPPVEEANDSSWILPVSIACAVVGVLSLSLIIGLHRVRRPDKKHRGSPIELPPKLEEEDSMNTANRMTINADFDIEKGHSSSSSRMMAPPQDRLGKNPFISDCSSSERSSSNSNQSFDADESYSADDNQRADRLSGVANAQNIQYQQLSSLAEVDNDALFSLSNSLHSESSSRSMYRDSVEKLMKEVYPEKLDRIDDIMQEYKGREEELIGELSALLNSKSRDSQGNSSMNIDNYVQVNEQTALALVEICRQCRESPEKHLTTSLSGGTYLQINEDIAAAITDVVAKNQQTAIGRDSDSSSTDMYRVGVEALIKATCPEKLDEIDEIMDEYKGREEDLIGYLSAILSEKNRTSLEGLSSSSICSSIYVRVNEQVAAALANVVEQYRETLQRQSDLSMSTGGYVQIHEQIAAALSELSTQERDSSGRLSDTSSRSMYRSGVEALVKEVCPENLEKIDEIMEEYEGREEELIGHLSSMLNEQNREFKEKPSFSSLSSSICIRINEQVAVAIADLAAKNPELLQTHINSYASVDSLTDTKKGNLAALAQDDNRLRKDDVGVNQSNTVSGQTHVRGVSVFSSTLSDSSSVGSSDWSTDEGLSSLDASYETSDKSLVNDIPNSTLAAIGAASSISKKIEERSDKNGIYTMNERVEDDGSISSKSDSDDWNKIQKAVTGEDIAKAIEAGNWSAVSATAALLADVDPITDEIEKTFTGSVISLESELSFGEQTQSRASELSRLVEDGDWEGVLMAAAQYEGASDTSSLAQSRMSALDDMSIEADDRQFDDNDQPIPDDNAIRKEIESLLRKVAPDEIDNIDEMMLQFKGREKELLNTLRTMHDRSTPNNSPNENGISPSLSRTSPDTADVMDGVFEGDKSPWEDSTKGDSHTNSGHSSGHADTDSHSDISNGNNFDSIWEGNH